jgi:protein-S-isoprenylcysteine O-methyltransferase Ste14
LPASKAVDEPTVMDLWQRLVRHGRKEHPAGTRLAAIVVEAIVFVVAIPALLCWLSTIGGERWRFGAPQSILVLSLVVAALGLSLSLWTVWAQYRCARGTPIPIMATKKLLTSGPYSLCRNPMLLGTILYYSGISVSISSFIAMLGTVLFSAIMVAFVKLVEEKEMSLRFGDDYSTFRRRTPFIIPRILFLGRKPRS